MSTNNQELTNDIIMICPHCQDPILIEKINCGIFRHGTIIQTGQQMNPHETKDMCDFLFQNKKIYGCGKPFQIVNTSENTFEIVICDYI
jgi:hypothetical protein